MPYKSSEKLRAYNREYYRCNHERLLEKQVEKNRRLWKNRRDWLINYKKTLKCVRCGESHPATLAFHHKNSAEKSFEISSAKGLKIGFKRFLSEIEKCEVLCANCHAKEHWGYLFD